MSKIRRAFTLIEILTVLAITAMVAVVGTLGMRGTYRHMLLKKAARDVVMNIKTARMLAMEKAGGARLCIDDVGQRMWVTFVSYDDAAGKPAEAQMSDAFARPQQLADGLRFELVDTGSQEQLTDFKTIVFHSSGSCTPAVIQLGDGKNHYVISLTPAAADVKVERCTADKLKPVVVDLERQSL